MNMYTYICGRESNRFRNLDLREEGRNLNISGEEEIENSFKSELRSLKSLVAVQAKVRFPELLCGHGTFKSQREALVKRPRGPRESQRN